MRPGRLFVFGGAAAAAAAAVCVLVLVENNVVSAPCALALAEREERRPRISQVTLLCPRRKDGSRQVCQRRPCRTSFVW